MSEQKENPHFPVDLERLSILLQELPLNQSELAEQLHVSASEISKWKSGERQISQRPLKEICKLGGCNSAWLLGLSDHRQPEIRWKHLDITRELGNIDEKAQSLFLALLETVNEGKDRDSAHQIGKLFMKFLTARMD